jgi:hypothetical protein
MRSTIWDKEKRAPALKILNSIKPVTCAVVLLPLFELSGFLFSEKYQQMIEPGLSKW